MAVSPRDCDSREPVRRRVRGGQATVDAAPRSPGHLEAPIRFWGGNALSYLCPGRGQLFSLLGGREEVRERDSGAPLCGRQFLGVLRARGAAPGSQVVLSPRAGALGALAAGQGA